MRRHCTIALIVLALVGPVATANAQLTPELLKAMFQANRDGVVFRSYTVQSFKIDDAGDFFCGRMLAQIPAGTNTFAEVDYVAQIFPDARPSAKVRSVITLAGPAFPKENQDLHTKYCKPRNQ